MTDYSYYEKAYVKAVQELVEIYERNESLTDKEMFRKAIHTEYKKLRLDPDGKAVRKDFDIKCTSDALISLSRICMMEEQINQIVPVYEKCRRLPIIFFPCERGGINTSRYSAFGDRIDHTLFDLKMYFTEKRDECRLIKAYRRAKTKRWLSDMGSFEKIVDNLKIKGVFTDEKYNVYDLELGKTKPILDYETNYSKQWSQKYYTTLKNIVEEYELPKDI